ncbi:hypothetical protein BDN70DRAFT_895385 [Pholiota conissans]|uniref:Uncharacterized protein n=1 Tax=Pholiota conissans TaxID=109636 RepID=A0A9P5Z087_9AGAR|nr:hypothetical protein BDN70DRAFT_895385 [Pholiota conissans]
MSPTRIENDPRLLITGPQIENFLPSSLLDWLYDTATLPQLDPSTPPDEGPSPPNALSPLPPPEGSIRITVRTIGAPKMFLSGKRRRRGCEWDQKIASKVAEHAVEKFGTALLSCRPLAQREPPEPARILDSLAPKIGNPGRIDKTVIKKVESPPPPKVAPSLRRIGHLSIQDHKPFLARLLK